MSRIKGHYFAGLLAIAVAVSLPFQAKADRLTVVNSDEAGKNSFVINRGVRWNTSLEAAQNQARREGKLIFWMHMLGTIDGAT